MPRMRRQIEDNHAQGEQVSVAKKDLYSAPAPVKPTVPERMVSMYGYAPCGTAGHYTIYKMEIPASDSRLVKVAEKLGKRVAFEKVLFLARQEIFRAVVNYKRPPQDGA